MTGVQLPWKSTTAGLSVFDTESPFRPIEWLNAAPEVELLYKENDSAVVKMLDYVGGQGESVGNPITRWIEDTRMEAATTFNNDASASDTYLDIVDPYIVDAKLGSIFVPETGEVMEVVDTDYAKADGWTNAAGDTANVRVTRGIGGTAATAATAGYHAIAGSNHLAEQSDLPLSVGRVPGKGMYNFVSFVGATTSITKIQENSTITGDWGTLPKASIDLAFQTRQKMGMSLLFEPRRTETTTNEGQKYISGGAIHYIKDNVLDLGAYASNASWENINDFLEATFEPAASTSKKVLVVGRGLFRMFLQNMRDLKRIDGEPTYDMGFGAQSFRVTTDSGYSLPCVQDKFGLSSVNGLSSWGFLLDLGNIEKRSFTGFDFQWIQHIEARKSVMQREDGYYGSYSLVLKHQKTHGVIRGGTNAIVTR